MPSEVSKEDHALRLLFGAMGLALAFLLTQIGIGFAEDFGVSWYLGAVGIWACVPLAYLLGTALDRFGRIL